MKVIGHHDEFIELQVGEPRGQRAPCVADHAPGVIQSHLAVHDVAKQRCTVLHAERYEVSAQ
ncbi:MAG: hypothetical protein ACT4QE_22130 [Anaerolineales bacterium]